MTAWQAVDVGASGELGTDPTEEDPAQLVCAAKFGVRVLKLWIQGPHELLPHARGTANIGRAVLPNQRIVVRMDRGRRIHIQIAATSAIVGTVVIVVTLNPVLTIDHTPHHLCSA